MLPHVANVFGFHHPSAEVRRDVLARASAVFPFVWEPAEGWVAGECALPDSSSRPEIPAAFAFAEGRDVVFEPARDPTEVASELIRALRAPAENLRRFRGDFTFVHFDTHGRFAAVRSCVGVAPLFVHRGRDCVAIATRLGDLVELLPDEPELDPTVLAIWTHFNGLVPEHRSLLRATISVPLAHAAIGRNTELRVEKYWDPNPSELVPPTRAAQREHAQRLRSLLTARLEANLDSRGRNLLLLSGGVDSSVIASISRRSLDVPFATATFLPSDPIERRREESWVASLRSALELETREHRYVLDLPEALRLREQVPDCVGFVFHPAAGALAEIARSEDIRVLYCGTFADNLCGSLESLSSWADATSPRQLLLGIPFGSTGLRVWFTHRLKLASRRLDFHANGWLPRFVRDEHRREAAELARDKRLALIRDRRPLRVLWERIQATAECTVVAWEASTSLGVRRLYSFLSREIVELSMQCHPLELIWDGPKQLLRLSLGDVVPADHLNRADKGRWSLSPAHATWSSVIPPELGPVLRPDWWPRPPNRVDTLDALRLSELVNIVRAARTRRRSRGSSPRRRV
jgi:asparagine synthetase B (glutamine-hydrolysing)